MYFNSVKALENCFYKNTTVTPEGWALFPGPTSRHSAKAWLVPSFEKRMMNELKRLAGGVGSPINKFPSGLT